MHKYINIAALFCISFIVGCGGTTLPTNPIKEMKKEFETKEAYTITLHDMDMQDQQFVHKYKVFDIVGNNTVKTEVTDWKNVDDDFFLLHEDDLGMEIFSKRTDGKYNNLVTPPGFTHFVGNEKYGEWKDPFPSFETLPDSTKIWEFNNNFAFLENELGLTGLSVSYGEFHRFQSTYLMNRPYYGQHTHKDSTKYGTRSHHWVYMRPLFYTRRIQRNNFDKPYHGSFSYDNRGGGGFGK